MQNLGLEKWLTVAASHVMLSTMLSVRKCKVDLFLHDRQAQAIRPATVASYAASPED